MKNNLVKISLAAIAMLMIAAAQNSLYAQEMEESATSNQSSHRIIGAWETTITPRNCETGEQIAPVFHGVITFNEGGTVAEFGANPATPYRTPGHGIWKRAGGALRTEMRFSFMPLTPAGVPVGRLRVWQEGEVSRQGDESSSAGGFVLTNFSGVVLATGCSTSTAVRLTL